VIVCGDKISGGAGQAERHLRQSVVRDRVRDKLDFGFEDIGELQVKNIARPARVYECCPAPSMM